MWTSGTARAWLVSPWREALKPPTIKKKKKKKIKKKKKKKKKIVFGTKRWVPVMRRFAPDVTGHGPDQTLWAKGSFVQNFGRYRDGDLASGNSPSC